MINALQYIPLTALMNPLICRDLPLNIVYRLRMEPLFRNANFLGAAMVNRLQLLVAFKLLEEQGHLSSTDFEKLRQHVFSTVYNDSILIDLNS